MYKYSHLNIMRTLWNLKAYETELPPLGLSEDNLEENFIMVHQSSKTKLLEWAQGVSVIYQTVGLVLLNQNQS